ncbi:MAG TPA: alpha-hydroxy acid oxidase [Gaiellaceae bacterium]|nr:alpha-hydroxy acid oxidase [Gaiellaceae bacterium]
MSGRPVNVDDYAELARERLEAGPYDYIAGGAGDEHTLRANAAAYARWELRPRVLVDVGAVTTAVTVLGTELALPLLVAPTAFQRLCHPDGERSLARAAAAAGTVMTLSTLSSVTPAELAAEAPGGPKWFQLYWSRDRGFTQELVQATAEAGFTALMLTVDLPVAGRRERDVRAGFVLPDDLPLPNIPLDLRREDFHAALGAVVDDTLTWRDLEWLRSVCSLPLVVKGILTAEDALLAAEHGAAAVVVSNHGGRQLDGVPASLDALPEVVESVGERVEVLVDGGVRRGTDVLKALALGASAALTGRAVLWGLAADGEQGAAGVLELLRRELETGLKLLGCTSPAGVTRSHLRRAVV